MNTPVVSIIVATNRGGPFLKATLDSVAAQSFSDHEIIIVDDGTFNPNLKRTAEQYGAQYIPQQASGVSAARNVGAARSTSPFLVFLDDDDVWSPEKLERQVGAIVEAPNAVASYSGGWYIDENGREFGEGWEGRSHSREAFLEGSQPIPRIVTVMIRREAFVKLGGFNPAFRLAEDSELILRLLQEGEFVAVDRQLVGYRRHTGNITNTSLGQFRRASSQIITLQIWSAENRGDFHTAGLLRQNHRALNSRSAAATVNAALAHARAREIRAAATEVLWGMRHDPRAVLRSAVERVSARRRR